MTTDASVARPMAGAHEKAGATFRRLRNAEVPRHYGAPDEEYRAAVEEVGVVDRSHRARWVVTGRDPAGMLDGILTNRIPDPARSTAPEVISGRGIYGLTLTPKGKVVSDHRLFRRGGEEEDAFLLDVPPAGVQGLRAHFEKYLPPLYAKVDEITDRTGMLTLVGPGAAELATREALGLRIETGELEALAEDEFRLVGGGPEDGIRLVRYGGLATPAWDLLADRSTIRALWLRLTEAGARPVGYGAWEALRIEAGRPAYGDDVDDSTLPVEAGIHDRAIDYEKGCYTGQEVIVRIRDRGRVNWHLRGLLFGEETTPAAGTELFAAGAEEGDRALGRVTSATYSPRFGRVAGLGYVRREVEPPAELRIGGPEGASVAVRTLDGEEWSPDG